MNFCVMYDHWTLAKVFSWFDDIESVFINGSKLNLTILVGTEKSVNDAVTTLVGIKK